jgi:hypothetical protein
MATSGEIRMVGAAFRQRVTGRVVSTGPFHDVARLPGGLEADLDDWIAGFLDATGRFLDRAEAAAAIGLRGRLECVSYLAGDPEPTLEAGHAESWRRCA